jgi:hypothetical protein
MSSQLDPSGSPPLHAARAAASPTTDGDELDDAERTALHRSIDESIADEEAGNVEDLSKIIAGLRAQL